MSEIDLGSMFSVIRSPCALGVRRDVKDRECWISGLNTQFQDYLSVDAREDLVMRIYYK